MSLIRYSSNPRHLQEEIRQVFDKFLGEDTDASSVVTSQWVPRVDIKEEADRFVIFADLPGVDPESIDSANPEGITASGRHGVLEIAIPKRPETTPRRIQVM